MPSVSNSDSFTSVKFLADSLPEGFSCRVLTPDDLSLIMTLQERIVQHMTEPTWFCASKEEQTAFYLNPPHRFVGIFKDDALIAFASLFFPGLTYANLALDLGWPEEEALKTFVLDTIVVDPDCRGLSFQRKLIWECVRYAESQVKGCHILATVSPFNRYSLRNVQAEGFQILMRKEKYGGLDRYILGK